MKPFVFDGWFVDVDPDVEKGIVFRRKGQPKSEGILALHYSSLTRTMFGFEGFKMDKAKIHWIESKRLSPAEFLMRWPGFKNLSKAVQCDITSRALQGNYVAQYILREGQ